tara:strand:+ start:280 stop:474 length:195 start_codon:yes stop_codon:yes gene_type:complete
MTTELKVCKSNAGYYIGTEYYDEEMGMYIPNSRDSEDYYATYLDAETALRGDSYMIRLRPFGCE